MKVNPKRIQNDIEQINKYNSTPGKGLSRLTLQPSILVQ